MFVLDRIEGEWAVIEYNQAIFNIPRNLLPRDVKEGDVINLSVSKDIKATQSRYKSVQNKADSLFEDEREVSGED